MIALSIEQLFKGMTIVISHQRGMTNLKHLFSTDDINLTLEEMGLTKIEIFKIFKISIRNTIKIERYKIRIISKGNKFYIFQNFEESYMR